MIPELKDFARRLADEIQAHQRLGGTDSVAWALRKLAARDPQQSDVSVDDITHDFRPPTPTDAESWGQALDTIADRAEKWRRRGAGREPSTDQGAGPREATADRYSSPSSAPAAGLPPLDPALVEECARAFYTKASDITVEASMRAALTHYRERVERPLREELAREVAAGRRYIELTDMAIACGTNEDPASGNCGWCRACVLAERDKLRAERNEYDERGHEAQIEIDRLRAELATLKAQPAPATDEERKRLAAMVRGMTRFTYPEIERIATLLEEPPRRKSLGRRFVLRFEDGEISTRTHYDLQSAEVCASAAGAEIITCDLVPVEEGES